MQNYSGDALQKIRQQYDNLPFPQIPLEESPQKRDLNSLFIHSLVTPHYLRNQQIVDTTGKTILDAGCGSGYKALILAQTNPNAKIVGVDLSEPSVEFARLRLAHHGYPDAEFHAIPIEEIAALDMHFDYINCDEVLSVVPEPLACLRALKAVLKPEGIIRVNFNSALQRHHYYRAQSLFKMMGLMDDNSADMAVEIVLEVMQALKNDVDLKQFAWHEGFETGDDREERILMNHLLQGDRGFTIPEVFTMLRETDLEFIRMVAWQHWELLALFNDPENLPLFLGLSLPELSLEDQLTMFEVLHPRNRLLDFWCGYPQAGHNSHAVSSRTEEEWNQSTLSLHPVLNRSNVRDALVSCIQNHRGFNVSQFLPLPSNRPVTVAGIEAACLLLLFEGPQRFENLVEQWRQWYPVDLITRTPTTQQNAAQQVKAWAMRLETYLYVLINY